MNKFWICISLFVCIQIAYCQQLHHDMISSQGGSSITSNGYFVRYSVGQQSVTGTSTVGYVVQQGFQQSNWAKLAGSNTVSIVTTVYPNPFIDIINFSFSISPGSVLDVLVFDVLGRLVHSESIENISNTVSLDLKKLSSAEYLVRLSSDSYIHSTKIIKQ